MKKTIKTSNDIRSFLKACGFSRMSWSAYLCEYTKEIKGEDRYIYQINGADISEIDTIRETVIFSENGADPSITPMYRYSREYPNFKAMIEGESKRGMDFSKGLSRFIP